MPSTSDGVRKRLRDYYAEHFACASDFDLCGPDRMRLGAKGDGPFRPASIAAVGEGYGAPGTRRVVFVGINPNRWGEQLSPDEMREAFVRYFDLGNPGEWNDESFRLGLKQLAAVAHGKRDRPEAEWFPFCAWTNLLKCASDRDRGQPYWRMWVNCGPKVWGELEILATDLIIALGDDDVHTKLTEGAAHRGLKVTIPPAPWHRWWSEIEIAGKMVGVFCAYHPSGGGMKAANAAAKKLRQGQPPGDERIEPLLREVAGDDPLAWRQKLVRCAMTEDFSGVDLLGFIEENVLERLSNRAGMPQNQSSQIKEESSGDRDQLRS